jgi:LacI family transcriptional regulator
MPRVPKPKSVSIRDVAELAGVSLGSASRVINKVDNVTAETREKVEQAIAALAYRPNHAAQSLRLRTTRTIGCLLTDVTNPLYAKLFRALEERMRAAGYMMLLANSLNLAEREIDILSTFQSRGMDGVILAPGNERDRDVLKAINDIGVPAVILDRDMESQTDQVLFDHVPGMHGVVSRLAAMGHRRMALIVTQSPNRPMRRRTEGFRSGLQASGLAVDEELIVRLPTAMSPAFDAVMNLLQRPNRPTAIVAMGTNILNETLNAISALHLRIPHDVSVVSIGDPDFAANYAPAISSLRVDLDAAAQASTELLLSRLKGQGGDKPRSVMIDCHYIERQSCGPAPLLRSG